MILSLLFDGLSFLAIWHYKGLQTHPMKIFMFLSFANFGFMYSLLMMSSICEFKLYIVFNETTFGVFGEWLSLEYLVLVSEFTSTLFYQIVLLLNTCLCLDLIFTLRDPFKNPESRYNIYWAVSVIGGMPAAFIRAKAYNIYLYGWIVISIFLVYIICAITSAIFAFRRLR